MGSTILEAVVEFFAYLFANRLEKDENKKLILMTRIVAFFFGSIFFFIIIAAIYNNIKD